MKEIGSKRKGKRERKTAAVEEEMEVWIKSRGQTPRLTAAGCGVMFAVYGDRLLLIWR